MMRRTNTEQSGMGYTPLWCMPDFCNAPVGDTPA
jgi:hypothetical protein